MKTLVILGHPDKDSFNAALAQAYGDGAKQAGHENEFIRLGDLKFDPTLWHGYKTVQALEPDLEQAWEKIVWADHLVFVYPTWWGSMPALLKGFIDRVFLPGRAYQAKPGSPLPVQLLKGKTARLIVTMHAPGWYYRWVTGAPGHHTMKQATLQYCGVTPVRITEIPQLKGSTPEARQRYVEKIRVLGLQGK
jgi:putative NADPH-quinone reductase